MEYIQKELKRKFGWYQDKDIDQTDSWCIKQNIELFQGEIDSAQPPRPSSDYLIPQ